jgi:hypothetical protein
MKFPFMEIHDPFLQELNSKSRKIIPKFPLGK